MNQLQNLPKVTWWPVSWWGKEGSKIQSQTMEHQGLSPYPYIALRLTASLLHSPLQPPNSIANQPLLGTSWRILLYDNYHNSFSSHFRP
jgi:hypothetical protein